MCSGDFGLMKEFLIKEVLRVSLQLLAALEEVLMASEEVLMALESLTALKSLSGLFGFLMALEFLEVVGLK